MSILMYNLMQIQRSKYKFKLAAFTIMRNNNSDTKYLLEIKRNLNIQSVR